MVDLTAILAPPTALSSEARSDRYVRQTMFAPLGVEGQRRLRASRVLLVGSGALGSAAADLLVRAGIGSLTIVDRDYVELHNLQRQTLFDESDVTEHLPKAEAAAAKLRLVNHEVSITPVVADVDATNVEALARDVDVILDGTDNFETRYLLNDVAVKWRRPWVYAGVIGSSGTTMTVRPGSTACLRCVFPEPPAAGSAPTCDTAGVLGSAVAAVAAFQVTEVIKLASGNEGAVSGDLLAFDVWRGTMERVPVGAPRAECPACGAGIFTFLDDASPARTTVLCGNDAVQVRAQLASSLDLTALAERLRPIGDVKANPFLLRFRDNAGAYQLTIFPDGRTIVKGTTSPAEARSVYARFIGT